MSRLFVDDPLRLGERFFLSPPQSHYLLHVLRLKIGQHLLLFNGKDGEWQAQIAEISSKKVLLGVTKQVRTQPQKAFPLALFFAPLKAHRLEMTIEKTTELGVTELIPCLTEHTQVHRLNPTRLKAIAREAAEQSQRLTVPLIGPFASLEENLSHKTQEQVIFFCDTNASLPYLGDAITHHQDLIQKKGAVGIVIGPEGGWSPRERLLIATLSPPMIPVQLGGLVLRAETASLAALTLLQQGMRPLQRALLNNSVLRPGAGVLKEKCD